MESKHPALEIVLITLALGAFLGYHLWFFLLKTGLTTVKASKSFGINGKGKVARLIFTHIVSTDAKASILGVQQSRCAPKSSGKLEEVRFAQHTHSCSPPAAQHQHFDASMHTSDTTSTY